MSNVARIRVTIAGQTRDVAVGAFAQIAAKRRSYDGVPGLEAIRAGDPETTLYGVWIELEGPRPPGEQPGAFDKWLQSVEAFELSPTEEDDDAEDPTPAEPSGSSLDSPPTSE